MQARIHTAACMSPCRFASSLCRAAPAGVCGPSHTGYNYVGHDYIGNDYIGHDCMGNNYVGQNYVGHNYVGHTVWAITT